MKTIEHNIQFRLVKWFREQFPNLLIFAIPNGGSRGGNKLQRIINGKRLKQEGLVAGIPDLFVACASSGYHGLFIELKVKPNKPSSKQIYIINELNNANYLAVVCYDLEQAQKEIRKYLKTT